MPTHETDHIQYHYQGYIVVPGVEPGVVVKGIRGLAFDDRHSGIAECRTCEEGPACVEQGYASITRVLDDDACSSPFERWLKSEKFGRLDVEVSYCKKATTLCFEGYACKLERHNLKECDDGLLYETLTIKTQKSEDKIVAPVIMPSKPCARLIRVNFGRPVILICFDVSLAGGCVDNALFHVRNLLPLGQRWELEDPTKWLIVAGPAPGLVAENGVSTYSSPKKRLYTFKHLFLTTAELQAAEEEGSAAVQALWDHAYAEWNDETKLELVFRDSSNPNFQVSTCLDIELPPKRII